MKRITRAVMIGTTALLLAPAVSMGQGTKNQGYLVDRNGEIVKSARTGECVQSRHWTPAMQSPQCGGMTTQASQRPAKR